MTKETAEIGIIGGSGVYDPGLFEEIKEIKVYTPFGAPSSLVGIGTYEDAKVAFIPRHGRGHTIPPHKINYRANMWALRELGVKRVIASSAVGSLRQDYKPGDFVIPDQFIDRTRKRIDTFYDEGQVCHVSSADPFCPQLTEFFTNLAKSLGFPTHGQGIYVCIEGPRFSTRAESRLFRTWGADIIGMTLYPECVLAKEMELCYVTICMVTDYDVWAEKPVSTEEIKRTLGENSQHFKDLIMQAIPKMPKERTCQCGSALKDALV